MRDTLEQAKADASNIRSTPTRERAIVFDNVPAATRKVMRANKGKDTKPEMIVRKLAHRLGYRYRLHRKDLPGSPDLVFASRKKAVFVHGCFWHAHGCKVGGRLVSTRSDFWNRKFARNRERDARTLRGLTDAGWETLVLWECELRDTLTLETRIVAFLGRRTCPKNGNAAFARPTR